MESINFPYLSKTMGFTFFNKELPTQEMISKRRKLSECASDSNGEKQLNESFQKMELTGSVTTNQSSVSDQQQVPVKPCCPIPIRKNQKLTQPELGKIDEDNNFNLSLESMGIRKYLTLDMDQKISDILSKQKTLNVQPTQTITRKCFFPYGLPINYDYLISEGSKYLKANLQNEAEKMQEQKERDLFIQNLDLTKEPRISKEERAKKVELYLQKKQNRQWRAIRYETRKNLAQQRDRVQGRFVKSDKPRYQWLQTQEDHPMSQSQHTSGSVQERKQSKDLRKSTDIIKKNASNNF